MKYVKLFEEFANDSALNKIYITQPDVWGPVSGKEEVKKKFINLISKDNVDDVKINKDYPILNYNDDLTKKLLKEGRIESKNIYSHPDYCVSTAKDAFHNLSEGSDHVPKTVYTKKDALEKLNFPIIAKPAEGHSGQGIKIIKSKDLMEELDDSKFDTFSEYIDKAEEMRFMVFKGKPIYWMERTPLNDKAKNGDGDAKEEMEFGYAKMDPSKVPSDYRKVISEFAKIYEKLPYICLDMMKSKDGKIYVIEPNIFAGVPFDSLVEIYKTIYEDFYKKPIDKESMEVLDRCANDLVSLTLKKDGGKRFSVKK